MTNPNAGYCTQHNKPLCPDCGVCPNDPTEHTPECPHNKRNDLKTLEQWRASGLCLNEFLQVGDLIDSEFADYFLCVLPPATYLTSLIQVGEPYSHINGRPTFPTIQKTPLGWMYRGNCHLRQSIQPMPDDLAGIDPWSIAVDDFRKAN